MWCRVYTRSKTPAHACTVLLSSRCGRAPTFRVFLILPERIRPGRYMRTEEEADGKEIITTTTNLSVTIIYYLLSVIDRVKDIRVEKKGDIVDVTQNDTYVYSSSWCGTESAQQVGVEVFGPARSLYPLPPRLVTNTKQTQMTRQGRLFFFVAAERVIL